MLISEVTGDGCTKNLQLECNFLGSPDQPFGRWVVSICPANCDKTRAMCFCGEGAKYPNRPLAETCGFQFDPPSEPDGPRIVNWTKIDQDVFTTNRSIPGWCNVDPAEAYAGKAKVKEECDCKYDGLAGRFCEVPVESVCINQCSGHGHCRGGFCQVILMFVIVTTGYVVLLVYWKKNFAFANHLLYSFSSCRG
ncbi:hypothetical protein D0Y65_026552 [Glycine soja]|uniref:EGF-like domain-containing protein n=1 Tax=Glycine soja TaxID=3848 RepID=A0A445IKF7_GLYSO|nr:hypothetical protein D0Y65_026552 [Glycine soja]